MVKNFFQIFMSTFKKYRHYYIGERVKLNG